MTDVIVGLDIGTSNIRVAIGEVAEDNKVQILGLSTIPAKETANGVRNGTIINIEAVIADIKEAVETAEQNAGVEVFSCVTAIGGSQVSSYNSHGLAAIANKNHRSREITQADKENALESACATLIPLDRDFLHVIPQNFIVDGTGGIKDPIDMMAVRLETDVHIVTASKTSIQNVTSCVNRAGYELEKVWLKTLAQVQAVAHEDELDMGSILIDLGAGTTDVLVLNNGASVCSLSIPVGQKYVTSDISIELGIPMSVAEKIKLEAGCCYEQALQTNYEVPVPGVGGRPPEMITQVDLCSIIQPRMAEIFTMVRNEIVNKTDLRRLDGNIILTGGGAQMPGVIELAQDLFDTNAVRPGNPENLGEKSAEFRKPEYATVIGLIQSQAKDSSKNDRVSKRGLNSSGKKEGIFKRIFNQLF